MNTIADALESRDFTCILMRKLIIRPKAKLMKRFVLWVSFSRLVQDQGHQWEKKRKKKKHLSW